MESWSEWEVGSLLNNGKSKMCCCQCTNHPLPSSHALEASIIASTFSAFPNSNTKRINGSNGINASNSLQFQERREHFHELCFAETLRSSSKPYSPPVSRRPDLFRSSDIKIPSGLEVAKHSSKINSLSFGIENILKVRLTEGEHDHTKSRLASIARTDRELLTSKAGLRRAVFTDNQRRALEAEFIVHKYINKMERKQLSVRLGLTESQIRIWFQNQRMKWRNIQEREIMKRRQLFYHDHALYP